MTGTERRLAQSDTDRRVVQVRQNVCTCATSADVPSHLRGATIRVTMRESALGAGHVCTLLAPRSAPGGFFVDEARDVG